jgi:hypothetical protein
MACRKWNKPGIPHTGWSAIWIEDLGDPSGSCEMCDNTIRWVHYVKHPDYGELAVGCQCASKMTGSDAQPRENDCKQFWSARQRWIDKGWSWTKKENWKKREQAWDRTIVVVQKWGRWRIVIYPGEDFRPGSFSTYKEARAAAYDYLYADRLGQYTDPRNPSPQSSRISRQNRAS